MSKDPLDREREFRLSIERAALDRRRSRGLRPLVGRLRPVAGALLFLFRPRLLLVAAFLGFFLFIFGLFVKWTDAYACALAEARRNPLVLAELGRPVEPGFFAWTYRYSQEGAVTDTAFRTALEGPKGKGTLRVQWYESPVGSSLYLDLEKDGRRQVVYNGTIPCR